MSGFGTGIVYSKERGTWNLFIEGEWIFEGDYDQCENMYYNSMEEDRYDGDFYPNECF